MFKEFRNICLVFLGGFGSCFPDFLGRENKLENETVFDEIQDQNNPIWWGRSAGFLGPIKYEETETNGP